MNFHIFVIITTIVFYIILRTYKYQIQTESEKYSKTNKSNLIYVLFIPGMLYLTKFIFIDKSQEIIETNTVLKIKPEMSQISSDTLLSIPYPESSIGTALSSNN